MTEDLESEDEDLKNSTYERASINAFSGSEHLSKDEG